MKTKTCALAAFLAASAQASGGTDAAGYGPAFDTAQCASYLVGEWDMETPRIYAVTGEHLDLSSSWKTTFSDDGTFLVVNEAAKAPSGGTWSVEPGSSPGRCAVTRKFDLTEDEISKGAAQPEPWLEEWLIVDRYEMRTEEPMPIVALRHVPR